MYVCMREKERETEKERERINLKRRRSGPEVSRELGGKKRC